MSTFTYDLATSVGRVRLYIQDFDISLVTGDPSTWSCIFTDEEIGVFLEDNVSVVKLAAAAALDSIASSKAYLAMRRRIGDYDEDMTSIAKELRAQAQEYRKQVEEEPASDFAEMAVDDFTTRDILLNRARREAL